MYTPQYKSEVVIVRDVDGKYVRGKVLGPKGEFGESWSIQRLTGPRTSTMVHFEDMYKFTKENIGRFL